MSSSNLNGIYFDKYLELDLELSDIQKEDHSHYDAEVVPFTVTIRSKTSRTQDDILSIIRRMEGIKYFEVI